MFVGFSMFFFSRIFIMFSPRFALNVFFSSFSLSFAARKGRRDTSESRRSGGERPRLCGFLGF